MITKIDEQKVAVSVVIVSYNQQDYVIECLESVKHQSFKGIELIISDDCSTDNTWDVISKWTNDNQDAFLSVVTLRNKKNIGTSKNLSNALKHANGEYLKILAADDLLVSYGIEKFYKYAVSNQYRWVTSNVAFFSSDANNAQLVKTSKYMEWVLTSGSYIQLLESYKANYLYAPSIFMHREMMEKINYFEQGFGLLEDHPAWISLFRQGSVVRLLPECLVFYRFHEKSVSHSVQSDASKRYFSMLVDFQETTILPSIPKWAYLLRWHAYLKKLRMVVYTRKQRQKTRTLSKFIAIFDLVSLSAKLDPDKQRFNRYLITKYARRLERESKDK